MQADLILCDHAEAVNGKLYINGGGWTIVFAPNAPVSMYLAVLLTVEWTETNVRHQIAAELRTEDGDAVELGDPLTPVRVAAELELGRPPGVKPGSSLVAPMALGFGGLPLEVGGYVWHLNCADAELARKAFQVAAPPQLPGFPGSPS